MLDDFFIRALIAGLGLALVAGPLGCLMVWRRMSYFGDTMAHSALLGAALGLLLDISLIASVFAVAILISLVLLALQSRISLPTDALLGIMSHSTLALGLVIVACITWIRIDLMALLFGDILAVSRLDIAVIYVGGAVILGFLFIIWRQLLASTVSAELAIADGFRPDRAGLVFMLLLACLIAMAMKLIGIVLITALLIIPAATARRFSVNPEQMALIASLTGVLAVLIGLFASLKLDTPSGPSIVMGATLLFLLGHFCIPSGRARTDSEKEH